MKRLPVKSSSVKSVGYNRSELILEVEFNKGNIYHYFKVYPDDVIALLFGNSIGSYLMREIVKNHQAQKVK